jgi:hypothetical protein
MSEKTKEALDNAVQAHFVDEMEGDLLTDYIITMTGISATEDRTHGYLHACSARCAAHVAYGLAGMSMDFFSDLPGDDDDEE